MSHNALSIIAVVALLFSLGCNRLGIESETSRVANSSEPVSQDSPGSEESTPTEELPSDELPGDGPGEQAKLPKQPSGQPDLPDGKTAKPAAMNPPFPQAGDTQWVLDFYVFGGIEGRTDRLRISTEGEVILREWNKVAQRRPLTDEEAKEFAKLKKNYRAERRQKDDGPHPDGMSTGVFFAGEGKASGLAKITRFAETIIRPEIYKPSEDVAPAPKKVK